MSVYVEKNPSGLCMCGCGQKTGTVKANAAQKGYRKGDHYQFLRGHAAARHLRGKYRRLPDRYVFVPDPSRRRQACGALGRMSEHRLIVERVLGHPLPLKAQIHHIDGNKSNNAHSNLVVCENRRYHALLHLRAKALEECGNANARRCDMCKQYGTEPRLLKYGRHLACLNKYARDRRRLLKSEAK